MGRKVECPYFVTAPINIYRRLIRLQIQFKWAILIFKFYSTHGIKRYKQVTPRRSPCFMKMTLFCYRRFLIKFATVTTKLRTTLLTFWRKAREAKSTNQISGFSEISRLIRASTPFLLRMTAQYRRALLLFIVGTKNDG